MQSTAAIAQRQCFTSQAAGKAKARPTRLPIAAAQQQRQVAAKPEYLHNARTAGAKLCSLAAAGAVLLSGGTAFANVEKVAEFPTSGLIFKDTVKIIELKDDKVDGVAIYITDYQRSITERLAKDPFSDPSQASLTCVPVGPVVIKDEEGVKGSEGREIFSERKGLNLFQNKNLRVRRIYDEQRKVVLYVAYSTRFTGAADEKDVSTSRYRTSVCALPVYTAPPLVPVVAAAPEAAAAPAVAAAPAADAE